ncbi:MAG TPA: hypothetical protein VHR66_16750 [Gemmataceae bacterium]|jgi:hypothetical protein|nr:hypothetical protein [Gemmataceae bacterium]
MKTFRRKQDSFRARDSYGNEYEVSVYVDVTSGTVSGETWESPGFTTSEAIGVTGPFQGQTLRVSRVDGDGDYQLHVLVGTLKLDRIP